MLPITPSIHTRVTGLEPILQESKSCVLTICTTPYYLSRKSETRTHDRLLIRQEFWPAELSSYEWKEQDLNLYRVELQSTALPLELSSQKENHLSLSDKWSNSAKHSITAYTAHIPHNLIKTRQIIQFLILHQNWIFCICLNCLIISVDRIVSFLLLIIWVAGTGFEPATSGLWARLSSIW